MLVRQACQPSNEDAACGVSRDVGGEHDRHIAPACCASRPLLQRHLLTGETDRGLHDRPLTPPIVREAPQATPSLREHKRRKTKSIRPSGACGSLPAIDLAMTYQPTVSSIQECGSFVRMSGMSAFHRRHEPYGQVVTLRWLGVIWCELRAYSRGKRHHLSTTSAPPCNPQPRCEGLGAKGGCLAVNNMSATRPVVNHPVSPRA
jgi:hypothetical protein